MQTCSIAQRSPESQRHLWHSESGLTKINIPFGKGFCYKSACGGSVYSEQCVFSSCKCNLLFPSFVNKCEHALWYCLNRSTGPVLPYLANGVQLAGVFLATLLFSLVIAVCFMSLYEITAAIMEFFISLEFAPQGSELELSKCGGRLCESFQLV